MSDLSFEDFSSATQDLLTQSVERLLEREGYSTVTVTIHTAYEDQQLLYAESVCSCYYSYGYIELFSGYIVMRVQHP